MNKKRYIIEMGTGIEQHGQEMTKAAVKAVKEAISGICLVGLTELVRTSGPNDMLLDILVACPRPEEVNIEELGKALPFGQKEIKVVAGGMSVKGHFHPGMGDKSDEIIIANAAITISLDLDKVKLGN